jgi:glutathione peroxidase
MKIILTLIFAAAFMTTSLSTNPEGLYDFVKKDIRGKEVNLEAYKGKAVLIVNTASKCGFTPQYKDLQALYEKYEGKDFVILGFPANNFNGQEPGSDEEIAQFCEANYGVTFPMFSKVSVKGADQDPLFAFLTAQANQDFTGDINWNFEKFLIDKDGKLVRRFRSRTNPMSNEILQSIETILSK